MHLPLSESNVLCSWAFPLNQSVTGDKNVKLAPRVGPPLFALCCLPRLTLFHLSPIVARCHVGSVRRGPVSLQAFTVWPPCGQANSLPLMRFTVGGRTPSEHADISNRPFCICPLFFFSLSPLLSPSGRRLPLLRFFWPNKSLPHLSLIPAAGFWPAVVSSPDN